MITLPAPTPEFLARIEVGVGDVHEVGAVDAGRRRVIGLAGGTVRGDRLSGEVLPGGVDRQTLLTDGTTLVDTGYEIRTDDGALVGVRAVGLQVAAPEVLDALARGEEVDPSSYYFRTSITFETADPALRWLTRVVTVCAVARRPTSVLVDVHVVR